MVKSVAERASRIMRQEGITAYLIGGYYFARATVYIFTEPVKNSKEITDKIPIIMITRITSRRVNPPWR